MEISKKQAEFWGTFIFIMACVAILVLFIDIQMKNGILTESIRLRMQIEEFTRGQKPTGPDNNGIDVVSSDNADLPSDVLVLHPTGMEERNAANGATQAVSNSRKRRTNVSRATRATPIPSGD
jgi:hypothetical protein